MFNEGQSEHEIKSMPKIQPKNLRSTKNKILLENEKESQNSQDILISHKNKVSYAQNPENHEQKQKHHFQLSKNNNINLTN